MKQTVQNFTKVLLLILGIIFSPQVFALTHTIIISNNAYTSASLTITEGDVVIFELGAGASAFHPTAADNGTDWTTFTLTTAGEQFTVPTLSAGTHGYHCTNHGGPGSGMHGTITVNAATGTKGAQASKFGLTIAPNPFDNEVTLNIAQNHSELTEIRVTDILGNEVAVIDLKNSTSSAYRLDFSHLRAGIYFCNLYSDKGILETRKLLRTK